MGNLPDVVTPRVPEDEYGSAVTDDRRRRGRGIEGNMSVLDEELHSAATAAAAGDREAVERVMTTLWPQVVRYCRTRVGNSTQVTRPADEVAHEALLAVARGLPALDPAQHARFGRRKLNEVRSEIATLLCVVAQAGNQGAADAQRAYLAGIQRVLPRDHLPYLPRANGVLALDEVLMPLDALDPLAKQALVEGITAAISHDSRVTVAEAELLRTICGVLHCPLPPMLER